MAPFGLELFDPNLTPKEAVQQQRLLAERLQFPPLEKKVKWVAGADVAYSRETGKHVAAIVILEIPELNVVEMQTVSGTTTFPYIPGLLSYREIPVLLKTFEKIKKMPDVILCDGQGIAHPRGLGLASHLGLLFGIPTVGCAKSRLVGEYRMPGKNKGCHTPLTYKEEIVGAVLRTRTGVKPIFVSPGCHIDLESSLAVVMQCVTRFRLPEPTRLADLEVGKRLRLKH